MFYRKLLYSILLFSLSVFVAYNSHALFYYPVIISYLIVLLWHKCVSPWLSTRPNSSSLYTFLGIFLLISGTIAIYICNKYLADTLLTFDGTYMVEATQEASTTYPRLTSDNPLFFPLAFLNYNLLPIPIFSSYSISTFLVSCLYFLELIFLIFCTITFIKLKADRIL